MADNHENVPKTVSGNPDKRVQEERGEWGGKIEFFLTCLGQAVGLGNVWRFPYLAFKHGGGSFLVPYVLMLAFVGAPVLYLELTLGQYSALGSVSLIKSIAPVFSGIGYAIYFRMFFSGVMYNAIISWTLFYFFVSMANSLPWRYCDNDFNTRNCFDDRAFKHCKSLNDTNVYYDHTCFNASQAELYNYTDTFEGDRKTPSDEYLNLFVIGKSAGMGDFGSYQWRIALCYITCWVLIFLCCSRGVKSIGKVVYFTAVFPYVVLFVLLIRGVTLYGAAEGVKYFITPKWEELNSITVWQEAAVQIFFSLGLASGSMMTFASYNKFDHNITKDAVLVAIINSLTSILAGFVVFSVLGFMAHQLDKDIDQVASGGPGLAFVVYPDALTRLPISPLWSILFFFMLITLGLGSQFGGTENAITCMIDEFPHLRPKKWLILLIYCAVSCAIGLILCFGNGTYLVDLYFSVSGWNYLIIGLLEVIIISYIYGINKFLEDIEAMTGKTLPFIIRKYLFVLYYFVTPALLTITFLLIFIFFEPFKSGTYVFPIWANSIGWILGIVPVIIIIVMAFYKMFWNRDGVPLTKHWKFITTATEKWDRNCLANKATHSTSIPSIYRAYSGTESTL